jgi:hypothetical protein
MVHSVFHIFTKAHPSVITFSNRSTPDRTRRDRRVEEERVEQGRRGERQRWRVGGGESDKQRRIEGERTRGFENQ